MKQQNLKALQLASRFSLPPNALGYCGGENAPNKLIDCISTGNCTDVEKELENFIVLNPYLKTIAEVTGKDKFSYEVIEAYAIGNNLLNEFKLGHYDLLLENFLKQGVPNWFVDDLRNDVPKEFLPSHLFQVLHVGVGKVSGSVPYNLETINNCMIRWGSIEEIKKDNAKVSLQSLNNDKKLFYEKVTVPYSEDITPNLKIDDLVAIHWNQIILRLDQNQHKKLQFWTQKILDRI